MAKKLTSLDWIKAGLGALTLHGPQAIKAEPLAKGLKVSKGSFYWHFNNIADLKAAIIAYWQQAATSDIIADIEAGTNRPVQKLQNLVSKSTDPAIIGSEPAIRDWARYDNLVKSVIQEVDKKRLSFTASLFMEAGQKKQQASQSANLLYAALIGLQTLHNAELSDPAKNLQHLLSLLLKQSAESQAQGSEPLVEPFLH